MVWSCDRFERWFVDYHTSDEARNRSRAVAARRGVGDVADDLHIDWYLSMRTTLDRLRRDGRGLPDWVVDERSALRYVSRAVDNDALDLGRVQARSPRVFTELEHLDGSPFDPGQDVDAAIGGSTVEFDDAMDGIVASLNGLLVESQNQRDAQSAQLVIRVCLTVVELLRWPSEQTVGGSLHGGTTTWDQLVYEALSRVVPDRVERTADGRMSERSRQLKTRYGRRARDLLQRLAAQHLLDLEGTS